MQRIVALIFLVNSISVISQNDSINILEEIVLKGSFSSSLNSGYSVKIISDSILKSEFQSLGNLLQNQANLYFKQNGNGMVSSISLRGTGASQTGVYWNGIPINSSLNGQTDFNSLTGNSFEAVEIRRGGGSVLLGSGAIGGAINLQDKIIFRKKNEADIHFGLGSYNSFNGQFSGLLSSNKLFAKISLGGIKSDNDYPYFDTELKNENGEFQNNNINGVFGYRIDLKNSINFYVSYLDNDRNNSRTLTAESDSKLLNTDYRILFDWKYLGNRYTSSLKQAYLAEKFTYFFDTELTNFSSGKSNNFISKYDFSYYLNKKMFLNAGAEYQDQKGWGTNFTEEDQNILNIFGLFHHEPISKLIYNLSLRKGYSSDFEIPFIYALDAKYEITKRLTFKGAFSTNYRNPTFNDLYWVPGGNPDLKSEESKSMEFGLNYHHKIFQFNITSYYIKSKDLIQWQPVSGIIWQPQNIQDVSNLGIELSVSAKKQIYNHFFGLNIQYDYTIAEDGATEKQLIYVPFHKANAIFNYKFKKWNLNYYLQYTGEVYITTSNTQSLDSYLLSNININRSLLKNKLNIAFKINNLFDEYYQSVAYRPMPNRNFTLNINLKI